MTVGKSRNSGLDLARAIAILLVLIGHIELVAQTGNNHAFYKMGFYGVELFFVLSGFLIGHILLKDLSSGLNMQKIRTFWVRRWLRTLPLYYTVLIIREITCNPEAEFHFLHYVFLHTSLQPEGYDFLWFGETWSLAVEEWFYLLLPFVFLAFQSIKLTPKQMLIILAGIFFAFIAVRYFYVTRLIPSPDYNTELRIMTPLRLDSILFGVALAIVKLNFKQFYHKLSTITVFLFVTVSFIILNFLPNLLVYDYTGIKTIPSSIGFTLISIHFVLLLPFLESSQKLSSLITTKGIYSLVTYTSLFSYCIYLVHEPFYELFVRNRDAFSVIWWTQFCGALLVSYLVGYLSYKFIEYPVLNWRDRITKHT